MIPFDPRTGFLFIGLLYLILPLATWVALAGHRTLPTKLWCGGGLFVAAYVFLLASRGILPDVLPFTVANLLAFIASMMRIQSLRLDLGIPARWSRMLASALVFIALFEYLRLFVEDDLLRLGYVMLVSLVLTGVLVWFAWCLGKQQHCQSAFWIAGAYALFFVVLLVRFIFVVTGVSSTNPMERTIDAFLVPFVSVITAVVGHLGYVGIELERSVHREITAAAEQARLKESARLSEQIAQLDRQRVLGAMSASLGHELNQPLSAILTNAQVAGRSMNSSNFDRSQIDRLLERIVFNARRAGQIVERIRCFIRPSTGGRAPVDLAEVVREVTELVTDQIRNDSISLTFVSEQHPKLIMGDPIQLSQIVLNVIRNAIEALTLVARREIHVALYQHGSQAVLRVSDTGTGLDSQALDKAGTPFFSTKEGGLGMGLSISRSIAEQHGGTLSIANGNDRGAVVELNLPTLKPPDSFVEHIP